MSVHPPMNCQECGAECERVSTMQKYCRPCSGVKDRERKKQWAREHPQMRRTKPDPSVRVNRGRDISRENRADITWPASVEPDLVSLVRLAVPYSKSFSKNAMWSMASQGHVFVRAEIMALRESIADRLNTTGPWYDGKVWIDLFIEKPNARSDAINVVDTICDAIKDGIGIDDRWFSIRRLDWSIVKDDPQVYIGVGQEVTEHHRACSHCGSVLPATLEHFSRARSLPHGVSRACKRCTRKPKP